MHSVKKKQPKDRITQDACSAIEDYLRESEQKDNYKKSDNISLSPFKNKNLKYRITSLKNISIIPKLEENNFNDIIKQYIKSEKTYINTGNIFNDIDIGQIESKNVIGKSQTNENFKEKDELLAALQLSDIELIKNPDSWSFEYGEKKLAFKIVKNLNEAIEHINTFGSGHTDCIITENLQNAEEFMQRVDSAGVYHNVSTRFADGFRYGFGAEVGISTNKTHARGPVGLEGLTIYKYKLKGKGHVVSDYTDGLKEFHHRDLNI